MKPITVLLDAGHGVTTSGKRSPKFEDGSQFFEWKFTRDIAKRIKYKLEKEGVKCIILTTGDSDPTLSQRANKANITAQEEKKKGRNSILISIHANAAGNGSSWLNAHGWEIWTTVKKNNSDNLAKCFLDVFSSVFPNRKLRGHKEKNFTVLYKSNVPCVLTENFFYDNKEECEFLLTDEGRDKIAELHVKAILKYLN